MPGVTVEASSPALIEKVRTAVTDGEGRYRIVELRPGTYTVTFTLPGFNTSRREGIDLTGGFTATVNADLRVGALEETVTVTGASPLVDVQSARQQIVFSDELLSALPISSMTVTNLAAVVPGMIANSNVGGAAGFYSTNSAINMRMHGTPAGGKVNYDGMRAGHLESTGAAGTIVDPATVEEYTVDTGGAAESSTMGVMVNMIPKEGGNQFKGTFEGLYTHSSLQSSNLTDELRAQGLTSVNSLHYIYDTHAAVGGPIRRDRLWFFAAHREAGNKNAVADVYFNKTQGTPFFTPDLDRPSYRNEVLRDYSGRVTWQASPRSKFNFFVNFQDNCVCRGRGEFVAPEAATNWDWPHQGNPSVTWSSPMTSRLLLEAGFAAQIFHWPHLLQPEASPDDISTLDQLTNFTYGSSATWGTPRWADRYSQRFSMSYVTGSHALKVGFQLEEGVRKNMAQANGDINYRFRGRGPDAVPNQVTLVVPREANEIMKADSGIFVQDRWTVKRLTINAGLRFDYVNSYVPEQTLPANRWLPAREFAAVSRVPEWTDLNPRMGASYDLFGNGRTALRASVGRYVSLQSVQLASANNPVNTSVNSVNRTWNDSFYAVGDPRRQNYVPDCDLLNPVANGECGAFDNLNFGRNNPNATSYADEILRGFGVRPYLWDISTEVQQQLGSRMSVTAGYFRNWDGNFTVTDNQAVTPADYDPYCMTAPADARLPSGGSYPVCGLYDIKPERFGLVSNLVTRASILDNRLAFQTSSMSV